MSELHRKIKQVIDSHIGSANPPLDLDQWRKQILLPVHDEISVEMVNPVPSAVDRLAAIVDEDAQERVAAHDHDVLQGILRMKVRKPISAVTVDLKIPNSDVEVHDLTFKFDNHPNTCQGEGEQHGRTLRTDHRQDQGEDHEAPS